MQLIAIALYALKINYGTYSFVISVSKKCELVIKKNTSDANLMA
jgi:hypothetical protein